MADTVFHKIMRGELPRKLEYEDDDCIVIHPIDPKAPVHLLVIPKKDMENLESATNEDQALLGKLLLVAKAMADKNNIGDGFKIAINNGKKGGQEVFQLHIHVTGGWKS
ncbi:MAG: HIT domain-containing protein [bacterium]|nr:HIT domain-containing protein [bacterium]